jgi:hypothetical protein
VDCRPWAVAAATATAFWTLTPTTAPAAPATASQASTRTAAVLTWQRGQHSVAGVVTTMPAETSVDYVRGITEQSTERGS